MGSLLNNQWKSTEIRQKCYQMRWFFKFHQWFLIFLSYVLNPFSLQHGCETGIESFSACADVCSKRNQLIDKTNKLWQRPNWFCCHRCDQLRDTGCLEMETGHLSACDRMMLQLSGSGVNPRGCHDTQSFNIITVFLLPVNWCDKEMIKNIFN